MNSPKIFELAKDNSDNLWVGSPWSAENPAAENKHFIAAYQKAHNALPDQFAAQAYDAMYIVAQALKKVKLTGKLEADRTALRDALPAVQITGATGPFKFRQVTDKDGKPAGYDAVQTAIVMIDQGQSIRHSKIVDARPATRQRDFPGRRLCALRSRFHPDLRRPERHQPRPWRGLHARRLRGAASGGGFQAAAWRAPWWRRCSLPALPVGCSIA